MNDQLFFRKTESAPRMYAARLGTRAVIVTYGWPFPSDRFPAALHVFDALSGLAVARIEVGEWYSDGGQLVGHACHSAGRDIFVAGLDNQAIRRWDLRTGARIGTDLRPGGHVTAICSMPSHGRTVLTVATRDGQVGCYDVESGAAVLRKLSLPHPVWSLWPYHAGDRPMVAVGDDAGEVWRWDPSSDEPPAPVAGRHDAPTGRILAAAVADRTVLVTSSGDNTVRVWDAIVGQHVSTWVSPASPFEAGGISGVEPFGEELVIAYADTVVWVDPATGGTIGREQRFPEDIYGTCLLDVDGRPALIVSSDMVYRLDPQTFAPF